MVDVRTLLVESVSLTTLSLTDGVKKGMFLGISALACFCRLVIVVGEKDAGDGSNAVVLVLVHDCHRLEPWRCEYSVA